MNKLNKKKSLKLYTNNHPETTLHGTGFKNKDKAIQSIILVESSKKTKYEQFLIINVLYNRAKYHPHQTKDMKEAMKIFKKWLMKWKSNKKNKKKNVKKSKKEK